MIHSSRDPGYVAAIAFILAMQLLFALNILDDYLHARWDEVFVNAVAIATCLAAMAIMRPGHLYLRLYWVLGVVFIASDLYFVSTGTSDGAALFWLFFVPPMSLYFFGLGAGAAIIGVTLTLASLILYDIVPTGYVYSDTATHRFILAFILLSAVSGVLEHMRLSIAAKLQKRTDDLYAEKEQLRKALDDVKILRGLLPTCAACKNIRDEQGHWLPIESYISANSEADFSHSICPDCSEIMYSQFDIGNGTSAG